MFMTCTYNGSLHTLMETQHGVPIKWIKVQKLQDNSPGLPWCGTGPVPYTSDTSWPAGNRASRWRCVRRVRTGCPSSGRSRPCTPPTTPGHSAEWLCWRQCHLDYKKEKKWLDPSRTYIYRLIIKVNSILLCSSKIKTEKFNQEFRMDFNSFMSLTIDLDI